MSTLVERLRKHIGHPHARDEMAAECIEQQQARIDELEQYQTLCERLVCHVVLDNVEGSGETIIEIWKLINPPPRH